MKTKKTDMMIWISSGDFVDQSGIILSTFYQISYFEISQTKKSRLETDIVIEAFDSNEKTIPLWILYGFLNGLSYWWDIKCKLYYFSRKI